jgi:2-polyprenyl-3-methyl-5-hydroxy-6-metoxy-1,4-benzoquinol methylase
MAGIDRLTAQNAEAVQGYHSNPRLEMLDFVPAGARSVLDVGCGEGLFGEAVKRRDGAEVWGIELSEQEASRAAERLDRAMAGDVAALLDELPSERLDRVVFNDVLEHLVDPWAVLRGFRRTLRPDGMVVCSIPNVRYWHHLYEYVLGGGWEYGDSGILDRTHLRFFTEKSIRKIFPELGYRIRTLEGIHPIEPLPRSYRLVNLITRGRFRDTTYAQFACVAELAGA